MTFNLLDKSYTLTETSAILLSRKYLSPFVKEYTSTASKRWRVMLYNFDISSLSSLSPGILSIVILTISKAIFLFGEEFPSKVIKQF